MSGHSLYMSLPSINHSRTGAHLDLTTRVPIDRASSNISGGCSFHKLDGDIYLSEGSFVGVMNQMSEKILSPTSIRRLRMIMRLQTSVLSLMTMKTTRKMITSRNMMSHQRAMTNPIYTNYKFKSIYYKCIT